MQAKIIDNDWIYLDQVTLGIEPKLINHFSVKHPRARFIDTKQQDWDGVYRKYDAQKQRLARPFLDELVELCSINDIPLDVVDLRPSAIIPNPSAVDKDWLPGITLEDYQIEAIKRSCEKDVGIIKALMGAGKTEVIAGIIKLYDRPTVVIAEQRVVIEQIKERLKLRDIFDVGMFYGGETPNGQKVIVGSIQSLATPPKSYKLKKPEAYKKRLQNAKQFQEIVKKAEVLLVDECDKASSAHYRALFKYHYNGRYKFGFSATPFDLKKPVQALILKEHLGSIIYEVDRETVESLGRVIPIKFYMFVVGENGNKNDKTVFDIAEREQMIDNTEFHNRVAQIVQAFPNDKTLILVDTLNVEDLGRSLEKTIPDSVFIYGKTSKITRNKQLKRFENGEFRCLIGSKILKRGLSLNGGVDNLILCGGGQLWSNLQQSVGRALRINQRGSARVFGFLFLNNYYLYRHGREQLKAITNMHYEASVVFKDITVDGRQFINSRFRKPKVR